MTSATSTSRRQSTQTQPHAKAGATDVTLSQGCFGRLPMLLGVTLVSLVVLAAFLAAASFAYFQVSGRIVPGVSVGGSPLGGLSATEAATTLDRLWNQERLLPAIDTTDPTRIWPAQPSELGLIVDAATTAQLASGVGREQGLFVNLSHMIETLRLGWDFMPVIRFDPAAARVGLEAWAARVGVPPVEATLALEGETVVQAPGQPGKALDVEATLALLAADPSAILFSYGFVPLVMTPVQPAIGDVSAAAADAERLLQARPALTAYDPVTGESLTWTPSGEEIASWLQVDRGTSQVEVSLDPDLVAAYLEGLNAALGSERAFDLARAQVELLAAFEGIVPSPQVLHYQPRTHVVEASDTLVSIGFEVGLPYWKILEANAQVTGRELVAGETLTIPPRDAMLSLPVVTNKRIVISLSQQRMWVYQDGALLRQHVVSTGISRSPTLPGIFQVQRHIPNAYASIWDLYMPDFLGIYEAVPGFWNGIHGLPLLHGGVRLWADVLGRPASYGCIILDLQASAELYNWAEDGVVVEIQP